jgi:hypothetical protein
MTALRRIAKHALAAFQFWLVASIPPSLGGGPAARTAASPSQSVRKVRRFGLYRLLRVQRKWLAL